MAENVKIGLESINSVHSWSKTPIFVVLPQNKNYVFISDQSAVIDFDA